MLNSLQFYFYRLYFKKIMKWRGYLVSGLYVVTPARKKNWCSMTPGNCLCPRLLNARYPCSHAALLWHIVHLVTRAICNKKLQKKMKHIWCRLWGPSRRKMATLLILFFFYFNIKYNLWKFATSSTSRTFCASDFVL